jgi:hypothetical protein
MLARDRPPVHSHDDFRCWRSVSQGAGRPDCFVVAAQFLDQDLGLAQGVEDLSVEERMAKSVSEAFAIRGLTGLTRFDDCGQVVGLRHFDSEEAHPAVPGSAPAEARCDMGQDALQHMQVVLHAQHIRHRQQERIRGSDGLVLFQLLDQTVGLVRVAAAKDAAEIVDLTDLITFLAAAKIRPVHIVRRLTETRGVRA